MSDLLHEALRYHARGWSIFPLRRKKPLRGSRWTPLQARRADLSTVRQWFSRDDVDGVAVICGAISGGLVVRDFDTIDAYDRWAQAQPDLAKTLPTAQTSRGRHVYFAAAVEHYVKWPGEGEYIGNSRHYAALPPSRHPKGTFYRWIIPLPDGALPVIDPVAAGLLPAGVMDGLGQKENRKKRNDNGRQPKATESHCEVGGCDAEKLAHDIKRVEQLDDATLQRIARAVRGVQPELVGTRETLAFTLARTLKGIEELADMDGMALLPIVQEWHKRALPIIGTKPFVTTWSEFQRGWAQVKWPRAVKMNQMLERAREATTPPEAGHYDGDEIACLLVKLCRELQRNAGDEPFYLSARMAAELLGTSRMDAWRMLDVLQRDGLLQVVSLGDMSRKASRYRYVGGNLAAMMGARVNVLGDRLSAVLNAKPGRKPVSRAARLAELHRQVDAMKRNAIR